MIGMAIKFVTDFLTNIINGVITKWLQMRESYKRGAAEALNEIHNEGKKRKAKFDKIMATPVKKGKDLIASLRGNRNDGDIV